MLKTIHPLVSGTLLAILDDMGHGDEIVITDANFPSAAVARRIVDLPGSLAPAILEAVLSLLPLDDFVEQPVAVMQAPDEVLPMYAEFQACVDKAENRAMSIESLDPVAFIARARNAYAVISSGERRLYGNILLRKGVLRV